MTQPHELMLEGGMLGLFLSANALVTLADKGLLDAKTAKGCAERIERFAQEIDQAADPDKPVSNLATDLQAIAAILRGVS